MTTRHFNHWHLTNRGWEPGEKLPPTVAVLSIILVWSESDHSLWESKNGFIFGVHADFEAIKELHDRFDYPAIFGEYGFSLISLKRQIRDFLEHKTVRWSG